MRFTKVKEVGHIISSVGAYYDQDLISTGYHDGLEFISFAIEQLKQQAIRDAIGLKLDDTEFERVFFYAKSLRNNKIYGSAYKELYVPFTKKQQTVVILNANRMRTRPECLNTLLHELVHAEQYIQDRLFYSLSTSKFEGKDYTKRDMSKLGYENFPWEIEARERATAMGEILLPILVEALKLDQVAMSQHVGMKGVKYRR